MYYIYMYMYYIYMHMCGMYFQASHHTATMISMPSESTFFTILLNAGRGFPWGVEPAPMPSDNSLSQIWGQFSPPPKGVKSQDET